METYVVLAKLTERGRGDIKGIAERRQKNLAELQQAGIKIVADYAIMGDYDFLYIVEAPSNRAIMEQAVRDASHGTLAFHTMPAMPMDQFVAIAESLQG